MNIICGFPLVCGSLFIACKCTNSINCIPTLLVFTSAVQFPVTLWQKHHLVFPKTVHMIRCEMCSATCSLCCWALFRIFFISIATCRDTNHSSGQPQWLCSRLIRQYRTAAKPSVVGVRVCKTITFPFLYVLPVYIEFYLLKLQFHRMFSFTNHGVQALLCIYYITLSFVLLLLP